MTQIDFYSHVADKFRLACILGAKAVSRGSRVFMLTEDAESTGQIDRMLWTVPPEGFLPHCRARHELADITPIIVDHDPAELPHDQMLFNLRLTQPDYFGRFERLIEIVSTDEADSRAARERYRFYRDRGYEIRNHDMSQTSLR